MDFRHFEAISCKPDGGFSVASSSLTGNTWNGSLWYFNSWNHFQQVPNLDMYGVSLTDGIPDTQWYDNQRLLVASDSGHIGVWSLVAPGDELDCIKLLYPNHDEAVLCVRVSSDGENGRNIISGGGDGRVSVSDIVKDRLASFKGHVGWVTSIDTHPSSSKLFVSVGMDLSMKLWDLRKPQFVTSIITVPDSAIEGNFQSVSWSSIDEHCVASGSETGFISSYDTRNPSQPVISVKSHSNSVHRVSMSPLIKGVLASASDDGSVQVYDLNTRQVIVCDRSHSDFVRGLSWQQDHTLLSCGWDGKIYRHIFQDSTMKPSPSTPVGSTVNNNNTATTVVEVPMNKDHSNRHNNKENHHSVSSKQNVMEENTEMEISDINCKGTSCHESCLTTSTTMNGCFNGSCNDIGDVDHKL